MSTLAPLARPLITVRLVDGPCAGRFEQVAAWGNECWARVGKPGKTTVETQMWARYDHDPLTRGEYTYSGVTVTTDQLARGLAEAQADGHSYGESRGA